MNTTTILSVAFAFIVSVEANENPATNSATSGNETTQSSNKTFGDRIGKAIDKANAHTKNQWGKLKEGGRNIRQKAGDTYGRANEYRKDKWGKFKEGGQNLGQKANEYRKKQLEKLKKGGRNIKQRVGDTYDAARGKTNSAPQNDPTQA